VALIESARDASPAANSIEQRGRGVTSTRERGPSGAAVLRGSALMLLVLSIGALLQVLVVGRLQHSSDQQRLFDRFRSAVASGTLPLGALDGNGHEVPIGSPVAYLEIPAIGVKQVVVEGTTSGATFLGPGHRRDTVLPGQIGTSIIVGRRSLFGAPFAQLSALKTDDVITVTTGQGVFTYRTLGVRRAGDLLPAARNSGGSRLTLVTADGAPYVPNGALYVDADLEGTAVGPGPRLVTASMLPGEEQALAGDSRTLWALVLWLQALLVVTVAALWSWSRWGRAQTWIVCSPLLLLVSLLAWGEFARLFPNLA